MRKEIAGSCAYSSDERRCPLLGAAKQRKTAKQMTIDQIKSALKMGQIVNWKCSSYIISYRPATDELFVVCRLNNHMIGVGKYHKSEDFYIGGAK